MKTIAWLLLAAGFLPFISAIIAKAGGDRYDNQAPRAWLGRQEGWRARANAAQQNAFEALPLLFGAVLFALLGGAQPARVAGLLAAWLALRALYLAFYVAGQGSLRSLAWAAALAVNISILFSIP